MDDIGKPLFVGLQVTRTQQAVVDLKLAHVCFCLQLVCTASHRRCKQQYTCVYSSSIKRYYEIERYFAPKLQKTPDDTLTIVNSRLTALHLETCWGKQVRAVVLISNSDHTIRPKMLVPIARTRETKVFDRKQDCILDL